MRYLEDVIVFKNVDFGYEIARIIEKSSENRYEIDAKNIYLEEHGIHNINKIKAVEMSIFRK